MKTSIKPITTLRFVADLTVLAIRDRSIPKPIIIKATSDIMRTAIQSSILSGFQRILAPHPNAPKAIMKPDMRARVEALAMPARY